MTGIADIHKSYPPNLVRVFASIKLHCFDGILRVQDPFHSLLNRAEQSTHLSKQVPLLLKYPKIETILLSSLTFHLLQSAHQMK